MIHNNTIALLQAHEEGEDLQIFERGEWRRTLNFTIGQLMAFLGKGDVVRVIIMEKQHDAQ